MSQKVDDKCHLRPTFLARFGLLLIRRTGKQEIDRGGKLFVFEAMTPQRRFSWKNKYDRKLVCPSPTLSSRAERGAAERSRRTPRLSAAPEFQEFLHHDKSACVFPSALGEKFQTSQMLHPDLGSFDYVRLAPHFAQ